MDLDLSELFEIACVKLEELDEVSHEEVEEFAVELLKNLFRCVVKVQRENIFSKNEELEDMNDVSLRYVFIPYYISLVHNKFITNRIKHLEQSKLNITKFLEFLDKLTMLPKDEQHMLSGEIPSGDVRTRKVARYRKELEIKNEWKKCQAACGAKSLYDFNKMEREDMIAALRMVMMDSISTLDSNQQELEMLVQMEEMKKRMGLESGVEPDFGHNMTQEEYDNRPGIKVTRINPKLEIVEENIRNNMFRPYWSQPTETHDDYLKRKVSGLKTDKERQEEKERNVIKTLQTVMEEGLEDDEKVFDAATYKKRTSEDALDEIVKGYGNTKRM
eukprot:TRINITY_DN779915_c0_g1_i1.p1 TRINITY_DN779915_c0_g1~~TRINITY_DN779915_c0_g1_i1.p1  ORF type:complete len:331 (+),score=99.27 TRINITY_DN779915_c0_g1_i1:51-1043(+)